MKTAGVLFGALCAVTLIAPAQADPVFDNTSGMGREAKGIEFMKALYDGYVALSQDRTWSTDLVDAEHFNKKARRAARGSMVLPDEAMDRDLLDDDVPELTEALVRLRTVLDRGARTLVPVEAGQAQVAYDCWIEAAEGTNPMFGLRTTSAWREEDVTRCKMDFERAMSTVEGVTYFRLTGFRKPPGAPSRQVAVTPPPPMEAPKPFIVFFAFDSAVVDAAGNRVIDDAVATAERLGIVDFSVTGHADRSGAEEYNLALSLRRANAVRDGLVARGVKGTGISVGGRGEAEPAVPTADGVRERGNRRVEIILL